MCGILGIAAWGDLAPSLDDRRIAALRDTLAHRGPDHAGLWRDNRCALAHRRLAVVDTSDAGEQPMTTRSPRGEQLALVYNGELYNDHELRAQLRNLGARFRSACDTETLLNLLAFRGTDALPDARGMYAFALWNAHARTLTLARDPLGVKPLYYAVCDRPSGGEVVFASEPHAVAAHPLVDDAPDLPMVSAYITTIRTVLGPRTLFRGVRALRPGAAITFDLSGDTPRITETTHWQGVPADPAQTEHDADDALRRALDESVRRHLRADVPTCALLSGGLDSSAVVRCATRYHDHLRTYAAGAADDDDAPEGGPLGPGDDLRFARRAAAHLATDHAEAVIDAAAFLERWPWMVERLGVPLSTPNEVAIYTVAQRLRRDDCVVTLSGEGADELLAGYEQPMDEAWAFAAAPRGQHPGEFELDRISWLPPAHKPALLRPDAWRDVHQDAFLLEFYREEFDACAREADDAGVAAHLRLHRRINLAGLLQRLDTATMLASVEGRTPFADARLAEVCESIPLSLKYAPPDPPEGHAAVATATRVRTKLALRRAFAQDLPPEVVQRPKASFPLPFARWMGPLSPVVRESELVRALVRPEIIELIATDPARAWHLAWPLTNLALWERSRGKTLAPTPQ